MKTTYITTSIAYVNAEPHIGHLFELLSADVIARHRKLLGENVFFSTGADEHGTKVAKAARDNNKEPQVFVDEISSKFEALCQQFNVGIDYFIRTSQPEHKKFVQEKWRQLDKAGVLKKKPYLGLYCPGCEAFKTVSETEDGKCGIHETELEKVEEENWFLVIDAATKEKIRTWVNESVFPETRRQEVINIIDSGSYDEVSVSRSKEKNSWGVEVPDDAGQVMYVWVDALFNYISTLEINGKTDLWPADIQVIGKDILKFHAIIWPALLIATSYELPKKLLVHGFINADGKKMSKSLGNVVAPKQLLDRYGAEATRYLLLRQLNFYEDSNFVWSDFDAIYNGELANGIGNLVARVVGLARRSGSVTAGPAKRPKDTEFDYLAELQRINDLVNKTDQLITENELWKETEKKKQILEAAISNVLTLTTLLEPFTPQTSIEIRRQVTELEPKPLFPRLDGVAKE